MTFEPTDDTCELLLVGVACFFGMVGHVQQSVRRLAKCTMIKEVSEVSNTERKDMVVSQDGHSSLAAALLYSLISPWTSWCSGCILALCFFFCFSLLALSSSLSR